MTRIRFFRADGSLDKEVDAEPGQRLLDLAVIVEAHDFDKLPPASEEEEDLLDLAAHATRTSRLACQIILTDELESLDVKIPPGATNWMGR